MVNLSGTRRLFYRVAGILLLLYILAIPIYVIYHAYHAATAIKHEIGNLNGELATLATRLDTNETCDHVISSLPRIIDEPGLWCLGSNLDAGHAATDAITVQANDVTIDGRGLTLRGSTSVDTNSRGIIGYDVTGLTVHNLRIIGFNTGLAIADTTPLIAGSGIFESPRRSRDIDVSDVTIEDPTFSGMTILADLVSIEDSRVSYVGPTSTVRDAYATGIQITGNGCIIRGNSIFGGEASGNGEVVGIALYKGHGCRIEGNTISFETTGPHSRNFGIWVRPENGAIPLINDNLVSGAHYAFGPFGAYHHNTAAGPYCALFSRRSAKDDVFLDLGENHSISLVRPVMPGLETCPDDVRTAVENYRSETTAQAAYAVATAYAETDGVKFATQTLAWIMVAAELGHSLAKAPAASPTSNGYDQSIVPAARLMADSILKGHIPSQPSSE